MKKLLILIFLSCVVFGVGCAPDLTSRHYVRPKMNFGPTHAAKDLGFADLRAQGAVNPALLRVHGEVSTGSYYRIAEALRDIGHLRGDDAFVDLGDRWGDALQRNDEVTMKISLDRSPFALAAVGETSKDSLELIKENDEMLADGRTAIAHLLKASSGKYPWVKAGASIDQIFDSVENFGRFFLSESSQRLDPRMSKALRNAFNKDFFPLITDARREINSILAEKRAVNVLQRFTEFVKKHDITLPPDVNKDIKDAEDLSLHIEAIDGPQAALEVIVDIWQFTPEESREARFRPISKELYKFLKDKSDDSLKCLKNPTCGVITSIERNALRSKLKEYGVEKLRQEIADQVREQTILKIREQAVSAIVIVPDVILTHVDAEVNLVRGRLAAIRSDYSGFVRKIMRGYSEKYLSVDPEDAQLHAVEPDRISVNFDSQHLTLQSVKASPDGFRTGAEALGSSMSYVASKWNDTIIDPREDEMQRDPREFLAQVNKMLAFGGFKTATTIFPSWAIAIDPLVQNRHFDLRNLMKYKDAYGVPDTFVTNQQFEIQSDRVPPIGAQAQAELLRGLSGMIRLLRDWQPTAFDSTFGKIKVNEFIKDLPTEGMEQKLFPKDMMFALAVGNAAGILQNITKRVSPVLLINVNHVPIWADVFDFKKGSPALVAGVVDILAGERQSFVRTQDVARYLIAILEFLQATDGVEKTKAGPLVENGKPGNRPLDTLISARSDLRQLAIALANFISHQMQDADGGVWGVYSRSGGGIEPLHPRELHDQVVAIEALTKAARVLGHDIYIWSALDIFWYMNNTLWDENSSFYRNAEYGTDTASFEDVVLTLRAGEMLKTDMSPNSRKQWAKLCQPWMLALRSIK